MKIHVGWLHHPPLNIVKFQVGKFHLAPIKHMSLSENRMSQNPAADSWLYYFFC